MSPAANGSPGIVNLQNLLDEFSPLNPHFRPFRGCFFSQIWACAPLSHGIHKIEIYNYHHVDNTLEAVLSMFETLSETNHLLVLLRDQEYALRHE